MNPDPKPPKREKKKPTRIKRTAKEGKAKANYSQVIRKKAALMEYDVCEGCGRSDKVNDWSHHIPKSYRKDLENDPDNIARMCRGRCHQLVELGKFDELLNGKEIIAYLERVDIGYLDWKYKPSE